MAAAIKKLACTRMPVDGACVYTLPVYRRNKNIQLLQISLLRLQAMPDCENTAHHSRRF